MHKSSKTQTIIGELCEKLHCSELADDFERVNHAREMLAQLQQNEVFENLQQNIEIKPISPHTSRKLSSLLLKTKQRLNSLKVPLSSSSTSNESSDETSMHTLSESNIQVEEELELEQSLECEDLFEDAWLGFFRGYEIMETNQECVISENKQCIELNLRDENHTLENYLREGIRCFMIDLFVGTELENQKLIFKLRESELKISREYGFPVTATLIAMLSPRLQYTGMMGPRKPEEILEKGDIVILSTKRKYSSIGSLTKIYVNARFLIEDCKLGDFILVGPCIQLIIMEIFEEELKCKVVEPGILKSRLPVRFPMTCSRLQISLEELEDITFAREVGINVLICNKPGTQHHLDDFYDALRLLKCDNLRIFTRLVLNQYQKESIDLEWIAQRYDGFIVDLNIKQHDDFCQHREEVSPDTLKLSSAAESFLTAAYNMKKPIILKPSLIAKRQLLVQPHNILHIYYYPDKYIFSQEDYFLAFSFYMLQNAMSEEIPSFELSLTKSFCDHSELGSDSLARACVAASFESQAKAIVICSSMPDMSIKLSHFRPKASIIQVSATKSIGDYISLYHHIVFMHFPTLDHYNNQVYTINAFIFVLIFLKSRHILNARENLILVYGSEKNQNLCDKYLVYKFDEQNFANNLEEILFS